MLNRPNLAALDCLLVLSIQRSGSSMVCKDISNLGLGNPGEYFINVRRDFTDRRVVEKFWSTSVAGRFFSLKVMDNYLDDFLRFMVGRLPEFSTEEDRVRVRVDALEKLSDQFRSISIVHVHRNSVFEQAFSRYRATTTKRYHSYWEGDDLDISAGFRADLMCSILHELAVYRRRLDATLSNFGGKVFRFVYEDVTNTRDTYLKELCEYFGVEHSYIKDTTFVKLATGDEVRWARSEFDKYLG